MLLSDNKLRHIQGVAEYMYNHAEEHGLNKEEMYLLGLVHDIGYLFGKEKHGENGSKLLKNLGFKYWKEVQLHGLWSDEYSSSALNLLRKADLSIDYRGEEIGTEKRLEDIKERYGEDSYQYENVKTILDNINLCIDENKIIKNKIFLTAFDYLKLTEEEMNMILKAIDEIPGVKKEYKVKFVNENLCIFRKKEQVVRWLIGSSIDNIYFLKEYELYDTVIDTISETHENCVELKDDLYITWWM